MPTKPRSFRPPFVVSTALAALLALTPVVASNAAYAYDEQSTSAVNLDSKGVALQGYDPVSYFSARGPALGTAEFSTKHDGALYWFASATNRDAFSANPAKYAPAFGGFCAMGVAMNKKLDVDPHLWRIVDGKLYLNVHKEAQTRWLQDVKGNLAQAAKNWPQIRDKAPTAL